MTNLGPNKKRIAQLFRMLGSSGGERRNAFAALEHLLQSASVSWTDIGDLLENGEGKYTESEMQEYAQATRAEGVEAGIKIGQARASNGSHNGRRTLPPEVEMAEYCRDRPARLKDSKQRDFVDDVYLITLRGSRLTKSQLAYLASIYIKLDGKI